MRNASQAERFSTHVRYGLNHLHIAGQGRKA